jgi:hypothetical protein
MKADREKGVLAARVRDSSRGFLIPSGCGRIRAGRTADGIKELAYTS